VHLLSPDLQRRVLATSVLGKEGEGIAVAVIVKNSSIVATARRPAEKR